MRSKRAKHKPRTYWNDSDRNRAVAVYKATGAPLKTAEITGIPYRTLWEWMKQEWWAEKMLSLKAEDTAVLEDAATTIAKQALGIVEERLTNGDFVLDREGNLVRKPVGARDAQIIAAINIDKRRQFQEAPVVQEQTNTTERLLKLVEQFALLTNNKKVGNLIEARKVDVLEAEYIDTPTAQTKEPE